jgi:hypothetical protein
MHRARGTGAGALGLIWVIGVTRSCSAFCWWACSCDCESTVPRDLASVQRRKLAFDLEPRHALTEGAGGFFISRPGRILNRSDASSGSEPNTKPIGHACCFVCFRV